MQQLFTGTAPIVVTAAGQLQQSGDTVFPFKQDSNFWYLTGIDLPDVILVMDKGREYIILPERESIQDVFDGVVDQNALRNTSGIQEIVDYKTGWKRLGSRLGRAKHISTIVPAPVYASTFGFYTNPARTRLVEHCKEYNSQLEFLDLRQHLSLMRMVKQEPELAALQAAIDITIASLKEAKRRLTRSQYEYQVEAQVSYGFRRRGSSGHAFAPIVAAGHNATTIHHVANNGSFEGASMVLLDVGAEVCHYAADISRTYSLGEPSRRLAQVHDAVKQIQDYAFSLLGPGTFMRQYEDKVRQYTGEKLRELGLIKHIEPDTVKEYFPHATSHFLGLDVHDVGDYDRPLEPGVTITVEPGIYIAKQALGVRIEDDVLITTDGIKVLSKKLSRDL